MNLVEIFQKCDGIVRLRYDDFKPLGWTYNDYFRYMSFCDQIRAATIMTWYIKKAEGIIVRNGVKLEQSLINQRVEDLFTWLGSFSDKPLPEPKNAFGWMMTARTYDNAAAFGSTLGFHDDNDPNPGLLYQASFHFTVWIELFIKKTLLNEPLIDLSHALEDIEDLSEEELEQRIREISLELRLRQEPEFPRDVDQYVGLTRWAKDQALYNEVENLEDDLADYRERLEELKSQKKQEELKTPEFNPKESILYIYMDGFIICKKNKHDMTDVNCDVPTLNGRAIINAQYCRDCRKFVMSRTSYEQYMRRYKMIPIRFRCVNEDGTFPKGTFRTERAEYSPLSLAGYSVSRAAGFSDEKRREILIQLIRNGVLKKHEIIGYLELFINTNGKSPNMINAVMKWERDLKFLLDYDMENQDTYGIDGIKQY